MSIKTFVFCHNCRDLHNYIFSDDECLVAMNPSDKELFSNELSYVTNKICTSDYENNIDKYNININEITGLYCVLKNFSQICSDIGWNEGEIDAIATRHYRRRYDLSKGINSISCCTHPRDYLRNALHFTPLLTDVVKELLQPYVGEEHLDLFNRAFQFFRDIVDSEKRVDPKYYQIPQQYMMCVPIDVFKDLFRLYENIYLNPYLECARDKDIMGEFNKKMRELGQEENRNPRLFGQISEQIFTTAVYECSKKYTDFKFFPSGDWATTYPVVIRWEENKRVHCEFLYSLSESNGKILYIGNTGYGYRIAALENLPFVKQIDVLLSGCQNKNEAAIVEYMFRNSQKVKTHRDRPEDFLTHNEDEYDVTYLSDVVFDGVFSEIKSRVFIGTDYDHNFDSEYYSYIGIDKNKVEVLPDGTWIYGLRAPNIKTFVFCHNCRDLHNFISSDNECLVAMNPADKELFDNELSYITNKICPSDYSQDISQFNSQINELTGMYCIYKNFSQICSNLGWNESDIDAIALRHYRRNYDLSNGINSGNAEPYSVVKNCQLYCIQHRISHAQAFDSVIGPYINDKYRDDYNDFISNFKTMLDEKQNVQECKDKEKLYFQRYMMCVQPSVFVELFGKFDEMFLQPYVECSNDGDMIQKLRVLFPNLGFDQRCIGWIFEQAFSWVMEKYSSEKGNLIKKVKGPPFTFIGIHKQGQQDYLHTEILQGLNKSLDRVMFVGHSAYGYRILALDKLDCVNHVDVVLDSLHNPSLYEKEVAEYMFRKSSKVKTHRCELQDFINEHKGEYFDAVYLYDFDYRQLYSTIMLVKENLNIGLFIGNSFGSIQCEQSIFMFFDQMRVQCTPDNVWWYNNEQ